MNFHGKRSKLLKEVLDFQNSSEVSEQFKREFWELVEYIVISMLDKDDNFFGLFMIQVKREIDLHVTWPLATTITLGGFTMYFNPALFLQCDLREMQALFKHEIYHIMLGHYEREKSLKDKYSKLAISTAMDIAVNQYVKYLPLWCNTLDRVNKEFNLELKEDMTMEQYAELLQEAIGKKKQFQQINIDKNNSYVKEVSQENAHDLWNSGDLPFDNMKEIRKKIATNAYKGKAPRNIEVEIKLLEEKPEIQWNQCLKNLLPSVKRGYRKTITRKDRRMPERLDLRGKLPNSIPQLLIAIDISASMSHKEVEKIMVEILAITKNKQASIKVIECDNEIRRIYQLRTPKDIRVRSKKNGSTSFSPVFSYIKVNNLREHVLIYFTDGVGEQELKVKPINYKTLWVLTGNQNLSLKKPYGQIKRLQRVEVENYGYTYGLQAMREVIHEWAR